MDKLKELADALARKRESVKSILGKANATTEELTQADALMAEVERDDADYKSAVKRAEFATQNDAEIKRLNQPITPIQHSDNGAPLKAVIEPSYRRVAGLKNFTNEKEAYRFGQWFLSNVIAPAIPNGMNTFAKAVAWASENGLKAQNEQTNIEGGALVPTEFDSTIIDLREKYGVFRQFSKVTPMSSDTKTVPRRATGLTAYFVNDNDAITDSTKNWSNVQLTARKIAVLAKYSSELAEDAVVNVGDDLAGEISYAFANKEDECGFNGDSTSTYGGITGVLPSLLALSGTIANIAGLVVAAGNLYSEITLANFNSVVGKLPQYADNPMASWFCHRAFYYETMQRLETAAGGVTLAEVSRGDRKARPLFLGYPVNFTQVMPKTEANSQICLILGDLALASRFGDRRQTAIAIDGSVGFASDQWTIRGTQRFDIVVHDVGNAHATAASRIPGPVVGLITAAS